MTPTNPQKYACTSFSEFSVELRIIALSLRDFIMLFLRKQLFREDEWLNCVNCQYVGYLYECIYIICFYFHCIQGHHQVSGEIQTVVNIYLQCFVYILSLHIVKTVFKKWYPCFVLFFPAFSHFLSTLMLCLLALVLSHFVAHWKKIKVTTSQ